MNNKSEFETIKEENERLKEENFKLAQEKNDLIYSIRGWDIPIMCPGCKKRVKPHDSRIKITEFTINPKWGKGDNFQNQFKSVTLEQYHPNCWKKIFRRVKK